MLDQLSLLQNKLIIENGIDENLIEDIVEFIKDFKGSLLYPRVIKRKFNLDMNRVYLILNELVKTNDLSVAYEIYCSNCDRFQNEVYNSLNEIPIDINCEYCGKDFNVLKDVIVIFKVNK